MKVLILEDSVSRQEVFRKALVGAEVVCVETAVGAKQRLVAERFDVVFLDHDLGGQTHVQSTEDGDNGYAVAKWMSNGNGIVPGLVIVHTLNPVGGDAMMGALMGLKHVCHVRRIPFAWTKIKVDGDKLAMEV